MPRPLVDDGLNAELAALYQAGDRHYHGLSHIEALLGLAREYRATLADPEAVEAAIWFHDAIYDSRAGDNEARSAALARDRLAGRTSAEQIERIAGMIEATATHALPGFADAPALSDAALFLDMDLSILGASPADFDRYEAAVRREYQWVAEDAWRKGRAAVLEKFLARPHIFHTEAFRERFEASARANMARSISRLGGADLGQ